MYKLCQYFTEICLFPSKIKGFNVSIPSNNLFEKGRQVVAGIFKISLACIMYIVLVDKSTV